MLKKTLKFTVNQLIVNSSRFDLVAFKDLENTYTDTLKVNHTSKEKEEILSVTKITKATIDARFIAIYFNDGNKFPYTNKVIDSDLNEHANPRSPDEIELDDQFFLLVDVQSQRIFMSDQRRKTSVISWLNSKIKKKIEIKPIINEDEFIQKIKSVNKVCFTVVPNLFNLKNENILSNELVQDIYGFGAEEGHIELSYNDAKITEKILDKLKALIGQKKDFKSITVIGRGDENFVSIFNIEEIINAIYIDINCDNESRLLDEKNVFAALIDKIK